ncbi:class I SAM-dependent methyltransferase [Undibacterium sp. Di24W]|uniref:class I SAM-dependent methyltransferase n=1 Tax=Undibacterium sp. Di24W TaxID=3413033 RepID=UPI003BF1C7AF
MKLSIGLKSLLLQLLSLGLTYLLLFAIQFFWGASLSIFLALFLHCCIASVAALVLRFDWWWGVIQFSFPLLVVFFYWQSLPSFVYLIGLLMLSLLYWSTYRTQVPYYPSKSTLIDPLLNLLPVAERFNFVDLGSGMGGLLLDLSKRNQLGQFSGVEIAPLPWLVSVTRALFYRSPVRFYFANYIDLDLSQFRIVFCYLSPAAMSELWAKVSTEMLPGSLFLSYEFVVPGVEPDLCIELAQDGSMLYGWRI